MKIHPRVLIALIAGLTIMVGSFWLSSQKEPTITLEESTVTTIPRNFIQVTDSNNDQVPDWQEALAKNTINLSEESAGTNYTKELVTDFAVASLAQNSSTGFNTGATLLSASQKLQSLIIDKQYTENDINVISSNSAANLRQYGNEVAEIALSYTSAKDSPNELAILSTSLTANVPEQIIKLDPIIEAYAGMRDKMLVLPVPDSLIKEHLSLINVYQAMYSDITAFRKVFEDSLPTMIRLRRFEADRQALYTAITNLYLKLDQLGIQWSSSDTASRLIKVE